MAGLHVLSHSNDDKEHDTCIVCDYAFTNNLIPTLAPKPSDFEIENFAFYIPLEIVNNYRYTVTGTIITTALFSRPPPILL